MNRSWPLWVLFFMIPMYKCLGQTTGDYRSGTSFVSWSTASHWQTWDGSKWATASSVPDSLNTVYIQAGHTATLSGASKCHSIYMSTGTTGNTTGGDGQIALLRNTLRVRGILSCYIGSINTTVNSTNPLSITADNIPPPIPISKTSGGVLKFVGNTRNITNTGEWSENGTGSTALFDVEFALNSGQTATLLTTLKACNWVISSGTLETSFRIAANNNITGQGNVSILAGATMVSSASGSGTTPVIYSSNSNRCGTVTINGTLKLSGVNPYIQCSSYSLGTNSSIHYTLAGNQNFINASYSGATVLLSYKHLMIAGGGTKTTLASATTSIQADGSITMIDGAMAIGSGGSLSVSTSGTTLHYMGTSAQSATTTEWHANFQNLTVANSAGLSLGFSRSVNGTLTLASGTFSNGSNLTLGNGATVIRTGGNLNSTPNFGTSVHVIYNDNATALTSGNEIPTSTTILNNLTINIGNGVSLSSPVTVNGTANFIHGNITTTSTNLLTISTAGSVSGASNSSFVNGPVAKITNSTSSFLFPIGKGNLLRMIAITPSSTNTTTYTAEYFNSAHSNTSSFTSPILKVSLIDYFNLSRSTSGTPSDAVVSLYWGSNSGVSTSYIGELTIARWNGSTWVNEAATATGTSSSGTVVSNSAVSTFGNMCIANASTNNNSLPVTFLYFRGFTSNSYQNHLEWATSSELNSRDFDIERSEDAINFQTIGTVPSKSNGGYSQHILRYSFNDANKGIQYHYRLKQNDYNGNYKYSSMITLPKNNDPGSLKWWYHFPFIEIFDVEELSTITIYNSTATICHRSSINHTSTKIDVSGLRPGIYYVLIDHYKPIKFLIY